MHLMDILSTQSAQSQPSAFALKLVSLHASLKWIITIILTTSPTNDNWSNFTDRNHNGNLTWALAYWRLQAIGPSDLNLAPTQSRSIVTKHRSLSLSPILFEVKIYLMWWFLNVSTYIAKGCSVDGATCFNHLLVLEELQDRWRSQLSHFSYHRVHHIDLV